MDKHWKVISGFAVCFLLGFLIGGDSRILILQNYTINLNYSWIDPDWITAIVASLAFAIAAMTLWFGSLKGPDIDICEKPTFALQKIPEEQLDYTIPHELNFAPAQLIFLNNGTRSGVLKLSISFEPADWIKSYFDRVRCEFKVREKCYSEMPYTSTEFGESLIVEVRITVLLHDWKRYFKCDPVGKAELPGILCSADESNHERLESFCQTLRSDKAIGSITIISEQSSRTSPFTIRMVKKEIIENTAVGIMDEDFINVFQRGLQQWDRIEPYFILSMLQRIEQYLPTIKSCLNDDLARLEQADELKTLGDNLWLNVRSHYTGLETEERILSFILKSLGLEARIKQYDAATRNYNRLLGDFKKDYDSKELIGLIREQAQTLKESGRQLIAEVEKLSEMLRTCYISAYKKS